MGNLRGGQLLQDPLRAPITSRYMLLLTVCFFHGPSAHSTSSSSSSSLRSPGNMGWIARCHAGSSSSRAFANAEEADIGSSSQLEINIISAQDLKREKFVAQMHVYAVAWIREDYKLRTHVVNCDDLHPSWNAHLHFIVSDALLTQEKGIQSALTIELYCQGRLRDILLGTVRVLLSTLCKKGKGYQGAQSLALQIRRPSGRPQGILNIGSIILDLDSACMSVPPLLRNPHLFDDEQQQKLVKLAPLREFQEICRRSFSVSRDDVLAKEKLPAMKFSFDDNSLHKHGSLDLMDAVSEDDEDEDDLAMEVIYRKLKALSKGKSMDDDAGQQRAGHMSTKQAKPVEHVNSKADNAMKEAPSKGYHDEPSGKGYHDGPLQSNDDRLPSKVLPIQVCPAKLSESIKTAMESLGKREGKPSDKGDQLSRTKPIHQAKCRESTDYPRIYQDGFVMGKKQDSICDDGVVKVNKLDDSVVLVWKDLPLHKKELFSNEVIGKEGSACQRKPSSLKAIWARRASWALRKGAAKIHLSPSDKY
ncbi:hypothetical protein GOP47_0015598 [Adiantum capillus-veneris]|uniref:C2 domain-containing protein n=1 Tax=Adiantum capillus-veneris TaxID=13818 RepID=A0A9D4UKR5_ADICA|nr:hypothetical protein GOP47_0015598 [Adiantum capillus-veneris]